MLCLEAHLYIVMSELSRQAPVDEHVDVGDGVRRRYLKDIFK